VYALPVIKPTATIFKHRCRFCFTSCTKNKDEFSCCTIAGLSAQAAVEVGIKLLFERVGGDGGCIAIDRSGNVGVHFNVVGMAWASCKSGVLQQGIFHDELITKPVWLKRSFNTKPRQLSHFLYWHLILPGWPQTWKTWNTQGFLWTWKLGEFCATSGKNCNKLSVFSSSFKYLCKTAVDWVNGIILLELMWNDPWWRSFLHLLFVAITYGKVSLWLWKSLENLGNFFSPTLWPPCQTTSVEPLSVLAPHCTKCGLPYRVLNTQNMGY